MKCIKLCRGRLKPYNLLSFSTVTREFSNSRTTLDGKESIQNNSILSIKKIASEKVRKITMVTAYDFPSAVHLSHAGIDIALVGDSLGMVMLGYKTTQSVTVDDMLHHCRAVRRGISGPLVVGDLPFGSYEISPEKALETAFRFVKEGEVDAVKLEGGQGREAHIRKIVNGGIAVMGHVGLTPQSVSVLGGFKAQGRTAKSAIEIINDAIAVQKAGAFACVTECIPSVVAKKISDLLTIPIIGIGSGSEVDGQVLVYHDMLGLLQHPHHKKVSPRFCKIFGNVHAEVMKALQQYKIEVESGLFPGPSHTPYDMAPAEMEKFVQMFSNHISNENESSNNHLTLCDTTAELLYGAK